MKTTQNMRSKCMKQASQPGNCYEASTDRMRQGMQFTET